MRIRRRPPPPPPLTPDLQAAGGGAAGDAVAGGDMQRRVDLKSEDGGVHVQEPPAERRSFLMPPALPPAGDLQAWIGGGDGSSLVAQKRLENGAVKLPEPTTAGGATTTGQAKDQKCSGEDVDAPSGKKRRSSSRQLQEGSRCSRVNGRGWRCSQPTLVGYALCEHHLGKGRLRSVNGGARTRQLGRTEHPPRKGAGDEETKLLRQFMDDAAGMRKKATPPW